MKKLLIFIAAILFACNTSSYNSAYKDYRFYKQKYIESLIDNNKNEKIKALKEIVKCGKFLNFDVRKYEEKLNKLTKNTTIIHKKVNKPKNTLNKKTYSKYIKIHSLNPLKITIPNNKVTTFTLKNKKYYKKVIDIHNAITPKFVKKKIGNITLKIGQFNKNTVRIVYVSKKPFYFKYEVKNKLLLTYLNPKKRPKLFSDTKVTKKKKRVIVIDPGHGGKDVGGVGLGKRYEKIAALKIARYLRDYLQKYGYKVYMTRYGDSFIPLKKRTHFANEKKADLFISIHCNIAPKHLKKVHGIETYFLSPTRNERAIRVARLENKEIKGLNYLDQRVILNFLNKDRIISSNKLGIDVQNSMINTLKRKYSYIKSGGVKPAPFWVLVGTQMPAILIEAGYLTNPIESKRLFDSKYQRELAKGIAKGVVNYFKKNP